MSVGTFKQRTEPLLRLLFAPLGLPLTRREFLRAAFFVLVVRKLAAIAIWLLALAFMDDAAKLYDQIHMVVAMLLAWFTFFPAYLIICYRRLRGMGVFFRGMRILFILMATPLAFWELNSFLFGLAENCAQAFPFLLLLLWPERAQTA